MPARTGVAYPCAMGHRANFVLIEKGAAEAFHDQWAALGCTLMLEEGAAKLKREVRQLFEPTTELMDWAFAEGGFLIDYDQKRCIAFGSPDVDLDEMPEDDAEATRALVDAFYEGWPSFVAHVAKGWQGFTLVWDERGVDAFAEHLAAAGIASIETQKPSAPRSTARTKPIEVIVTTSAPAKKKAPAKKAPAKKATGRSNRRAR